MPFAKERNHRKVCCIFSCRRFSIISVIVAVVITIVVIIIMVVFVISAFVIILKCFIFLSLENFGDELPPNVSLTQHGFQKLNRYQETAVREALSKPFTLIQGPPGTSFASCDLFIYYLFIYLFICLLFNFIYTRINHPDNVNTKITLIILLKY